MKINNFSIDKAKKTQPAFFFGTEEVLDNVTNTGKCCVLWLKLLK